MNAKALHLNLLQESERLSSSPVRPRIVLPIIAGLIFLAMLGWWGFLWIQQGLIGSEIAELKGDIAANENAYAEICRAKAVLQTKEAELAQLKGYLNARHVWGETLAAVATAMPEEIQLTLLEIPDPPPQKLKPQPGVKLPPLLGPTNAVERVSFRLAGRTASEEHVFRFLRAVRSSAAFTNNLVIAAGDAKSGQEQSPRMRQFGQDRMTDADGNRAIVFDVEYGTPGRNFAP